MAPKPARFVSAVGMALTILAVMTCATAAPSEYDHPTDQAADLGVGEHLH